MPEIGNMWDTPRCTCVCAVMVATAVRLSLGKGLNLESLGGFSR